MRLRDVATVGPTVPGLGRGTTGKTISFLPLDCIWADTRFDPSQIMEFSGNVQSYNPVAEGDVLVPKVSPTFSHGRVAIARGLMNRLGLATSEVFVVRPRRPAMTSFLRYRLLAADFRTEGEASWTGVAGLKRISGDFLRNLRIDRPAWERHREIADLLDRESARLTRLVRSLDQLSDQLDERLGSELHQRLISEPSRRAHFGRLATLQRGFDLPDRVRRPGNVPVVGSGGSVGTHDAYRVRPPGVITGRYGSIGTVTWSDQACWPLNTTLFVLDFKESAPRYVYWALRALPLKSEAAKAAVPGLHRAAVHRLRISVPNREQQETLADYFDDLETRQQLLQKTLQSKQLALSEYRDALITEAVTGQLDVTRLSDSQLDESAHATMEGERPEVLTA